MQWAHQVNKTLIVVLQGDGSFHHSRPFNHKCNYCGIEYDVIGHMEDYEEDMLYIATKLNLISLIPNMTQVQNETPGKKASSAKRIKEYMSQLSHEQRQKLYYFYKIDFEMFEYEHEFVYDYAFRLRLNR